MAGVHYSVRQGDQVALIDQHHEPGQERIENGSRGEVFDVTPDGGVLIKFDVTARKRVLAGDGLARYQAHKERIGLQEPNGSRRRLRRIRCRR